MGIVLIMLRCYGDLISSCTLSPFHNRLTAGIENTLLHYVALHPGHGVMVCPTHATPPGPVHAELVQSFRQASVAVREVLRGKLEGGEVGEEEEEESDSESDEEHEHMVKVLST